MAPTGRRTCSVTWSPGPKRSKARSVLPMGCVMAHRSARRGLAPVSAATRSFRTRVAGGELNGERGRDAVSRGTRMSVASLAANDVGVVADSSDGAEPRAPWGGDGAARAPPLTRLTACPRAVCGRAYPTACPDRSAFQREIPMFSAESIILPEGLPRALSSGSAETRLYAGPMRGANWVAAGTPRVETPLPFVPAWGSSARSDVPAGGQDFSNFG
jgi:hypothetical protein